MNTQPLAYLYLSQIPYTGLELGPIGIVLYWLVLILSSIALAYLVLFYVAPYVNRSLKEFGARIVDGLNAERFAPAAPVMSVPAATPAVATMSSVMEEPRGYSSYDGFKSFARKGALSIDDIVKGLTREPAMHNVEPIYENVEPVAVAPVQTITESVISPLQMNEAVEGAPASADIRGFASALIEGDRAAVFAGLRQYVRGGGQAEQLISGVVCLLDDVYRARIDGTPCDADLARLAARFSTPTLEKLVASLTTAIDSSYSVDTTGAKLALTRALGVLGA